MPKILYQRAINLRFRKAWQDNQLHMSGQKLPYDENPYEHWLKKLKLYLKDNFTVNSQYYWDLLWSVNERGGDPAKMAEESTNDPEKDQWIKDFVEGNLHENKITLFYGDKRVYNKKERT